MSTQRSGLLAGVGAYLCWGLFPLYWRLLKPAAPAEILAHRITWSLAFLVAVLAFTGGFRWVRHLGRRRLGLLAIAAVMITINWATFIYGVNSGHVVETSLGYFINPLVTVALAVILLGERMRRAQWTAIAIAGVAVAVLAVDYGRPPWIALILAFSFASYGLVKKRAGVGGTRSIAVETTMLMLPALGYVAFLESTGRGTFASEGAGHAALLAGGGIVTAIPLMLFGAAAIRLPLATVGVLQYLTPVLQFLIGVVVYGEHMPAGRLAGFALVWVALAVFVADAIGGVRRGAAAAAVAPVAEPGAAEPALAARV